ncbi:MAG: DUF4870 domain-containing protein [Vulcanimicrobiota bacterium]
MEDNLQDNKMEENLEQRQEEVYSAPEATSTEPASSIQENKVVTMLSYVGLLVLIPLLTKAKESAFVKYHVKQGLVLLIAGLAIGIVSFIPFIGWIVGFATTIAVIVLAIMGILNVSNEQMKPLPMIGQYADDLYNALNIDSQLK